MDWHRTVRRGARSTALWVFGLSTTLLLIGMWGRVVVVDQGALAGTARAVLTTEVVTDRVSGWLGAGIGAATQLNDGEVSDVVARVAARPEVKLTIEGLIEEAAAVLLSPASSAREIDVAAALRPLVPTAVALLSENRIEIDETDLEERLDAIPPVVLSTEDQRAVANTIEEGRVLLTRVVALALGLMLLSGAVAFGLAEERLGMLRGLAIRVVVAAVSFILIFRFGAWALDPQEGRSPLAAGSAVLLTSNLQVFLFTAMVAGTVATGIGLAIRYRRHGSVDTEDSEDPTSELISV